MTTSQLSNLGVAAMHSHTIPIDREKTCERFMALHPRRSFIEN